VPVPGGILLAAASGRIQRHHHGDCLAGAAGQYKQLLHGGLQVFALRPWL